MLWHCVPVTLMPQRRYAPELSKKHQMHVRNAIHVCGLRSKSERAQAIKNYIHETDSTPLQMLSVPSLSLVGKPGPASLALAAQPHPSSHRNLEHVCVSPPRRILFCPSH